MSKSRKSEAQRIFEKAARRKQQASGDAIRTPQEGPIPGIPSLPSLPVEVLGAPAPPSHAVAPMPAGGLTIGYELRPPHSLRRAAGKPCRTDRWFDRCGLVYDSSQPTDGPMGFDNPRLFLAGTAFRCYYPNSTRADFAAIMSSGSSGRWLNAWSQKSSYVQF